VAEAIRSEVDPEYPDGYERLFVSIVDEIFTEPEAIRPSADMLRETL